MNKYNYNPFGRFLHSAKNVHDNRERSSGDSMFTPHCNPSAFTVFTERKTFLEMGYL